MGQHHRTPATNLHLKAKAGQLHRLAVLLQGLCRPDRLPAVCCKACAGRIVCQLFASRPVPAISSAGCVCLPRPYFAMPCLLPMSTSPVLFCIPPPHPPLVHYHVRQDRRASCKDCPVGSYNKGLHWRPVHRCDFCFFSLQSPSILGHG